MNDKYCDACIVNSPRPCAEHRPQEFIWKNMAFNSEDEMNLAATIPSVYLDRWSDAGLVAEAILASEWLADHTASALEDAANRLVHHIPAGEQLRDRAEEIRNGARGD